MLIKPFHSDGSGMYSQKINISTFTAHMEVSFLNNCELPVRSCCKHAVNQVLTVVLSLSLSPCCSEV